MSTLKQRYDGEIVTALKEELGYANRMRLPRLNKVIVNMGMGVAEKDAIQSHTEELAQITGQKPAPTRARKSISNFKLREGMIIGSKVTLRGRRMYEFLDRLINAALPRIRDFRGLSATAFDGQGNYTLGIQEQTIFPEIDLNKANVIQGLDVTIVTESADRREAKLLLEKMGFPFVASD
jgi:large subunit ribosomal protein L5